MLKTLRAIWISHSHADHHLGLMKVLQERRRVLEEEGTQDQTEGKGSEDMQQQAPVLIMAPGSVLSWLREYRRHVGDVPFGETSLVDLANMTQDAQAFLDSELGIVKLTNVGVDHCKHAYGVVVDAAAGWRLVYSGDCRPSERLVQAGKGAQVLIHEATFEGAKQDEALARKHCTVEEAVGVARRMEAQAVILTHFSQRYPKFPVLPTGPQLKICVAFDLMKVRPSRGRGAGESSELQTDWCGCSFDTAGQVFGPTTGVGTPPCAAASVPTRGGGGDGRGDNGSSGQNEIEIEEAKRRALKKVTLTNDGYEIRHWGHVQCGTPTSRRLCESVCPGTSLLDALFDGVNPWRSLTIAAYDAMQTGC